MNREAAENPPHYISDAPYDPGTPPGEPAPSLSQTRLLWRRLKRNRLAYFSFLFLALIYASLPFSEIIAPYGPEDRNPDYLYAPPQRLHLFHEGEFMGPFVYGYKATANLALFKWDYTEDAAKIYPLRFFCRGAPYRFWGLWRADFHLVCPQTHGVLYLLGTDRLGQDLLSRMIYGSRVSLTIGLIGISISFLLALMIGGAAGYFGGWVDNLSLRLIEVVRALPELPLWMALSAALPVHWSPLWVFAGLTVILGLLDWPGLARAVRAKLIALREEDYTTAAILMGAGPARIIGRHLLPNFMSHLTASAALSIPSMILGETALSFLGLGLRPPVTSWGVLLVEAQNLASISFYPWILLPMAPVILVVMAFNFFGDGLRDAADPYS